MSPDTIRATLARLWETNATAYDIAWAVLKAEDIESDDLEIEVESVISRALKAREFIDLGKLAAEVAKLLPPEVKWYPADADQAAGRAERRLQLEIGKTYRNREGDKVKIVGMRAATAYRYDGDDGSWYAEDGRFNLDEPEHGFDLVEECEGDEPAKSGALTPLPLCEVILDDIASIAAPAKQPSKLDEGLEMALEVAVAIINKHFAALSVDELASVIEAKATASWTDDDGKTVIEGYPDDIAQAVMRLLRRE